MLSLISFTYTYIYLFKRETLLRTFLLKSRLKTFPKINAKYTMQGRSKQWYIVRLVAEINMQ